MALGANASHGWSTEDQQTPLQEITATSALTNTTQTTWEEFQRCAFQVTMLKKLSPPPLPLGLQPVTNNRCCVRPLVWLESETAAVKSPRAE